MEPASKGLKMQNRSGITKASNPFHPDCWRIVMVVTICFSIVNSIHLVGLERKE